jgi:hypothetical protein
MEAVMTDLFERDDMRADTDLNTETTVETPAVKNNTPTQAGGWRDRLLVHPAAELFPLMSKDELQELADDIDKHGLQEPVAVFHDDRTKTLRLIDGRNRLDALQMLGRDIFEHGELRWGECPSNDIFRWVDLDEADTVTYVISKNIRRRHLTTEQKRDLIAKLLKLNPEKSNLQIAKTVGADDKTVASVRADPRSEIPNVEKRTDTKGRKQPARRKKAKREPVGTSVVRSDEAPANSVSPESADSLTIIRNPKASLHALLEFKFACDAYLWRMSADDLRKARDYVIAEVDEKIASNKSASATLQ